MSNKDKKLTKKKELKTFSIHEKCNSTSKKIKNSLFQYKHVENILNILLKNQLEIDKSNLTQEQQEEVKEIFWLLLNPVIMKAVLSNNIGGEKTKDNIAKVNSYFKNNDLFNQAKLASQSLNDKNISMIIRRLKKDWDNYFEFLKEYYLNPSAFSGKPSYPKAKKLSKVFNYSLPLESDKYSLKKKGYLGINLGKKMFYTYLGKSDYFKDKIVNNVTIIYSHGFIYYNFSYEYKDKFVQSVDKVLPTEIQRKEAGGDIGLNNLLSIFVNDLDTKSLIVSGSELISYNCYFNKCLAELNELISYEVKSYKSINDKNGKLISIPESYTNKGKSLIKNRSELFERRKLFFDDCMNKISKKVLEYLSCAKVTDLVLSKNLSFTKTDGSIQMQGKTKQKFYQIPFGNLLNLIGEKSIQYGINITWIDEAYTSKTSSISSNVVAVQNKNKLLKEKEKNNETISSNDFIMPIDLNGNRGTKKSGNKSNKLGRGLFKDTAINKVLNADLNAACNHIKVAFNSNIQQLSKLLWKWCNPVKVKSNHEFDSLLKSKAQIVDIRIGSSFYLSDVVIQK